MKYHAYRRGHFPRGTLGTLWGYVERDGAAPKLFYAHQAPESPVSVVGDLTEFVQYFDDAKRHTVIVERDEPSDVMGMVWFDDIVPGHRAAINAFYRRRYWGKETREATAAVMRLAFEAFSLQSLWAYTPWPEAQRHAEAIGLREVAVLPGFTLIGGQPRDIHILKIAKEDLTP